MSAYDKIARVYDPWSRSVVEDVPFYVEEAVRSGGPVLELGVGTGRIAVPIAAAGIRVVGVDLSAGMLEVARENAALAGAELDLRHGDMRDPPVDETFPLVICPFRSLLHMETDEDRPAAPHRLVDVERHVLDHAPRPRVVQPGDLVVRAHAAILLSMNPSRAQLFSRPRCAPGRVA